jgi:hypothetical protein
MRLSRILRADDEATPGEVVSTRRIMFWAIVWVALFVGMALYFRYARSLTPLLA